MTALTTWEMMSYVVTVIGLPLAISVFIFEQRKERDNEEEEVYQLLSDNYQEFLKLHSNTLIYISFPLRKRLHFPLSYFPR